MFVESGKKDIQFWHFVVSAIYNLASLFWADFITDITVVPFMRHV